MTPFADESRQRAFLMCRFGMQSVSGLLMRLAENNYSKQIRKGAQNEQRIGKNL